MLVDYVYSLPRASQSAGAHRRLSERAKSLDSRDFSKRAPAVDFMIDPRIV